MIWDIYSWLDLSRWTERLSRGLLTSKIGSSVRSAKLRKLQNFRKQPFGNGGYSTLSKIVFLSSFSFIFVAKISHAGFPAVGLSSKCRLQRGVVLSQANLSRSGPLVRVAPHWNLGVIIDSLCGHFSRKSFTGTLFILNFCLYHMVRKKITFHPHNFNLVDSLAWNYTFSNKKTWKLLIV